MADTELTEQRGSNTKQPVVDLAPSFPPLSSTYTNTKSDEDGQHYVKMEDGDADQIGKSNAGHTHTIASSVMTAEGLADPTGFLVICCVCLIGDMNRGVVFPIMWPLVEELGGNTVWLGYAVGAFSFGRIIASPCLGRWSITWGYSNTLILSTSLTLVACLLFAQTYSVGSLYYLVFTQITLGIGSATLGVTRAYVADITATRERTSYIGLITAVQYGGFTVTPLFGALFMYILQDNRYQFGFLFFDQYSAAAYFMALLSAGTLALVMTKFQNRTRSKPISSSRSSSRFSERDEVANQTFLGCMTVYDAALLGCMLLNIATKGSIGSFETLGISFAESHFNLEPEIAGIIVSFNGLIGVIALLSMGQLGRIFTDIQMIFGGIAVCALGIISFSMLQSVEDGATNATWRYFVGILMIYGIGYPIGHTALIGIFSKIVGRQPQGTLQGWFAAAGSLARILFPIMSGYITQYDDITTVFKVLFGILFISNVFVAVNRRTLSALAT